jgi:L-rhamnose mutarotase
MEIDDLETAWEALSSDPISQKWEKQMSLIFDAMPPTNPTERFPMMNEVFHLE